jgi:hypothetical protein
VEVTLLAQVNWVYTLRKRGERYFLSVVCGGVGMYDVEVELSAEFASQCMADRALLSTLSENIRFTPERFMKSPMLTAMPSN